VPTWLSTGRAAQLLGAHVDGNLSERMSVLARDLLSEESFTQTTDHVVAAAVDLIEGCSSSGISLAHRNGTVETTATTDETGRRADALQQEIGEGPCLDAVWDQEVVLSRDLAEDPRWSTWGPAAVEELGVRSLLCVRLYTNEEDTVGALNLFSTRVDAFDADDEQEALAIAAHAAVAMAAAKELEGVRSGLDTRTVIGQATGMVMERYEFEAPRAFGLLVHLSTQSNRKLRDIARDIVTRRGGDGPTN
jgi:GAF domain-containing protein